MRWAFLLLGVCACSSSSNDADGGRDAELDSTTDAARETASDVYQPLKARAAVASSFAADAGAGCTGALFSLGQLPGTLVEEGADAGGTAVVTCSVQAAGPMFQVTAHAEILGSMGAVDFTGKIGTSGAQTLDIVMLSGANGTPLNKMMCAATFPPMGGVSAGKVWVTVACPGSMMPAPDGCPVNIEARFENCAQ